MLWVYTNQNVGHFISTKTERDLLMSSMTTNKQNLDQLADLYLDVINSHDVKRIGEIVAENCVGHFRTGKVEGLESFQQFVQAFYDAFPDIEWFADTIVTEGDMIASHYHWVGTHRGPLMGIPATGKQITVYGMELDRCENHKIVEAWNYVDQMSLLQQLGVLPALATSSS